MAGNNEIIGGSRPLIRFKVFADKIIKIIGQHDAPQVKICRMRDNRYCLFSNTCNNSLAGSPVFSELFSKVS